MKGNQMVNKMDRIERMKSRGQYTWANMSKEERGDTPRPNFVKRATDKRHKVCS